MDFFGYALIVINHDAKLYGLSVVSEIYGSVVPWDLCVTFLKSF